MQQGTRVLLRIIGFTLVLLGTGTVAHCAQDTNLLRDGGFEGTYTSRGRADLNIPADWSIWVGESPHTEDWMNLPVGRFPAQRTRSRAARRRALPQPEQRLRDLHGGGLPAGERCRTAANVTASAWAFLRTCKIPDGASNCTSTPDSNAFTRIGIDPNGGTNPFDVDVVWSANAAPHETWGQMNVSATATGEHGDAVPLRDAAVARTRSTTFTGTTPRSASADRAGWRRLSPARRRPRRRALRAVPVRQRAGRARRTARLSTSSRRATRSTASPSPTA